MELMDTVLEAGQTSWTPWQPIMRASCGLPAPIALVDGCDQAHTLAFAVQRGLDVYALPGETRQYLAAVIPGHAPLYRIKLPLADRYRISVINHGCGVTMRARLRVVGIGLD